jgi:hypothetical protein
MSLFFYKDILFREITKFPSSPVIICVLPFLACQFGMHPKEKCMTEKGFIVYFQGNDEPEYLFDERNEIRHFDSEEEAAVYLQKTEWTDGMNTVVKYHDFCHCCAGEFFFDAGKIPEDTKFYICSGCMKHYKTN